MYTNIYRLSFCNLVGMFDLVCCQLNCNVCHCAIHPSYSCTCHYHYVTSWIPTCNHIQVENGFNFHEIFIFFRPFIIQKLLNHIILYSHFTPSNLFTVESEFIYLHPCYMHYNIQTQTLIILLFCIEFIFCYNWIFSLHFKKNFNIENCYAFF